ncbi:MAG: branched-chain amino acid ABC transporter permease [Sphaerochaetaceae bacterium]|jgi:branched-chain amino acid transport system permease protein
MYITELIINGLIQGSLYALIAIGFTMVYGILRLINFAHGDVMMIGAFLTIGLLKINLPWQISMLLILLVGGAVGFTIDKVAFRPMRGAPQVTGFIASLALSLLLQNLGILLFSAQPRNFFLPEFFRKTTLVFGLEVRYLSFVIVFSTFILLTILLLFVKKTKLGIAMRATAENLQVARLMGIRVNTTIMVAFVIGSGLAAYSGMLWGGRYGQVDPLMGFLPGLKAFVAAVIGGVGSIAGAAIGGYILGFSEILFVGLLPVGMSGYRDAFVFGLLIIILLFLPNGILGTSEEVRA